MAAVFKMRLLLEYEAIFANQEPVTVDQCLEGGNRQVILNASAFFLGFSTESSKYENHLLLLKTLFGPANAEFAKEIYLKIRALEASGERVIIINAISSLSLFEKFFSRAEAVLTQTDEEFEINLFKAYLLLNSEFTSRQEKAFASANVVEEKIKVPVMAFCMHYAVADKLNLDIAQIWATQILRAFYLFEYLEANPLTQNLLVAFLQYFGVDSWKNYLRDLISLTMPAVKKKKESYTDIVVAEGLNFVKDSQFIEKLVVKEIDTIDPNDFLTIRAKPFYKVKSGVYRIIFDLFVVEKIFKGAYFLLRDINKTLPEAIRIPDLKGIYGHQFSEQVLLYKVLEIIYNVSCKRFSGKTLDNMEIKGAPDYYIRKGKHILLFESKDFLMLAKKKTSFEYSIYEPELAKTLYFEVESNGNEKAGAVMQLIKSIKEILQKKFIADKDYNYREVTIYPIIVTHDHQFDVPGLNEIINSWFFEELGLLKEEGLFIHRVQPVTIVNIDSLIFFQEGLVQDFYLHEILDLYIARDKKLRLPKAFTSIEDYENYKKDTLIPFSIFIENHFIKHGIYKIPPIIRTLTPILPEGQ